MSDREIIEAQAKRIAELKQGLELAANRLVRCAVEMDTASREFVEWKDWAEDARSLAGKG